MMTLHPIRHSPNRSRVSPFCATFALLLLLTVNLLAAAPAPKKLRVVTSFLPAYCHAVNIGAGVAQVENLLSGAVTPHDFQLAPKDIKRIEQADLLVVNGLQLEEWLMKITKRRADPKRPQIVACSDGLDDQLIVSNGHAHHHSDATSTHAHHSGADSHFNPHIWLDPSLAMRTVTNLTRAFIELDPSNTASYKANSEAYLARLRVLDTELQQLLAPVRNRPFVTLHDAFPYFARRYQLGPIHVLEEVPEVSPSPRYLSELLKKVRQQKVEVIFTEPGNTPRLARQLAQDLRIQLAEVETLETGAVTATAYEDGLRRIAKGIRSKLAP